MPSTFLCSGCKSRFTANEALHNGNICPQCKGFLKSAPSAAIKGQTLQGSQTLTEHKLNDSSNVPIADGAEHQRVDHSEGRCLEDIVALHVKPLKGKGAEVSRITQLLNSIAGTVKPLCLEISGDAMQKLIVIRCKRKHTNLVSGAIIGTYGSPEIVELDPALDPARFFERPDLDQGYMCLQLNKSEGLPLRTWRELAENDPLLSLTASIYDLYDEEAGIMQLVIHDRANPEWAKKYKQELTRFKRRQTGAPDAATLAMTGVIGMSLLCTLTYLILAGSPIDYLRFAWMPFFSLVSTVFAVKWFGRSDLPWSESLEEIVTRKINQQGYKTEIRLAAASRSRDRVEQMLSMMAGAYGQFGFESGNALAPCWRTNASNKFNPGRLDENAHAQSVLGDEEIATLWHLPIDEIPDFLSASRVDGTLPDPKTVSNPVDGWRVGEMGKSDKRDPVYIPRQAITRKHGLIMGKTQQGKSTLLLRIITELARDDRAILVIDPHDDLIESIIHTVPDERIDDVIYLNFADKEYIPGFNILDITMFNNDPEQTKEAFLDVAKSLFGRFWGPRMQVNFDKTMTSLALANTLRPPENQFTILNAIELLTMPDSSMRLSFLESVLPKGHAMYDSLMNYWRDEFSELTNQMTEAVIMPVLSKLRPFEGNSNMLGIFGQPVSSFSIIEALLSNKIILVRTGATHLSEEYSDFIGSFILNWARRALFSQGELPAEERKKATIVVDESQSFTGIDYSTFLAQVAKYGANLLLTTQGTRFIGRALSSDQINDSTAWSTVMANIDTLVVFRIDGEDARTLCYTEFVDELAPPTLINTKTHSAFLRFSSGLEVVGPFLVQLDPPVKGSKETKAKILARRSRYSNFMPDAINRALESMQMMRSFTNGMMPSGRAYAGKRGAEDVASLTRKAMEMSQEKGTSTQLDLLDSLAAIGIRSSAKPERTPDD